MTDAPDRLAAALADRYRIERELGQGGMATVYLAADLKHDRSVAVKVLRPELRAVLGADRFLAEIKIAARLDHPHILTLIDSGASDEFLYYVLPYVRGESLREKLDRERQLGLDEALAITRQVAGALDFAHRHGVIHRDIKPENILLQEGEAMLADFGIALAVTEAGQGRLTETGLSLGTPQYMSPEQATGDRDLDARSDIYSLGTVLYEMLAGEPPLAGPTAQAVIAKLLTERPTALRVVRDSVPPGVEAAVARALAKTPADRFPTAGAFAAALAVRTAAEPVPQAGAGRLPWVVAGAACLGLLAFGAWQVTRTPPPDLLLGRSDALTTDAGLEIAPAISPDGRLVAYSAGNSARMRIYLRPVGGGRTIPLSDDSTAVEMQAQWSPDGQQLLYLTRGGVSVAPALGGSSRAVVAPAGVVPVTAAAWSPDGSEIAFARGDSLQAVPLAGGAARLIATASELHSCRWSPDGRWIACVSGNEFAVRLGTSFGNLAPSRLLLLPAAGGDPMELLPPTTSNMSPVWGSDSRHLYFLSTRDGPSDLYALSLTRSGRSRGDPVRLTTGLGASTISFSSDGRWLTYSVYTAQSNIWALPIPTGEVTGIAGAVPLTSGRQVVEAMRVSSDGRWLLYDSDLRGNPDIYRLPLGGGSPEQLTEDPVAEFGPDLSPDGRWVAYHSWRNGTRDIEVKPLDGGPVVRVTDTPAQESYPDWSPDGLAILFVDQVTPAAVWIARRDAAGHWTRDPAPLVNEATLPRWSPDGTTVAFVANATHPNALGPAAVIPAAGGTPRWLFTPGPTRPRVASLRWAPDGRTLYFKSFDEQGRASFWSVSADGGTPRMLVRFDDPDRMSSRADFATDGRRFYFAIVDRQSDVFVAEVIPQ